MTFAHWTGDDARIIGDIVVGSLLAGTVRLIIVKALLEPAAVFLGQRGYRWLDDRTGDKLPDFLRGDR